MKRELRKFPERLLLGVEDEKMVLTDTLGPWLGGSDRVPFQNSEYHYRQPKDSLTKVATDLTNHIPTPRLEDIQCSAYAQVCVRWSITT